ncbi:hypothetical protein [Sciscionella sediminilitoris]|uniref:hypothetical protein n=1 Tax=Sciscionella sediminilitoris TaxID=1445613 RepID=UPI00068F9C20|nr:hypothetical protein [Sciscionella sp. SE31]
MNDYGSAALFLALGVLLIGLDGYLITGNGRVFLRDTYQSAEAAAAANRLTVALFHLVALGLLALLAIAPPSGGGFLAVLGRLGVLLLVLAAIHGATMGVFSLLRSRQHEARLLERPRHRSGTEAHIDASHGIANDVPAREPYIAPTLDERR